MSPPGFHAENNLGNNLHGQGKRALPWNSRSSFSQTFGGYPHPLNDSLGISRRLPPQPVRCRVGVVRRIVITGGQGDLGKGISAVFHEAGWQIDAPARDVLDVSDPAAVAGYFASGSVDLLVCCAGIVADGPLVRMSGEDWDESIRVNFGGAAAAAAAVLPGMVERKEGHIVFISSNSAIHPPAGQAAYATAKASLLGLTTSLARVHGGSNVRVNAVLPGFLETKMTRDVTPSRRQEIMGEHCLGRFNTVRAVAGFIRYLHEGLPHTSGQIFRLDNRP
ncbi:MAG: SDR family NAD(P)-dependent oxidoreductase [Verrucomicrobiaceae bacterium]|nr:MAG: SDR family NAD(P)-dependent oxidoreductase [Verrucomicrobiaceae bacterium]